MALRAAMLRPVSAPTRPTVPSRRKRRLADLLLVAVVAALGVAVVGDALRSRLDGAESPSAATRNVRPAAVTAGQSARAPLRISLHSSPETTFLPDCRRGHSWLSIDRRGRGLVFRYAGEPCHLPPLHLVATVRDARGTLLYHGPALGRGGLAGANLAGPSSVSAPLLPGVLHCDVQVPVDVVVRGRGLEASGVMRCRGSP